MKAQLPRVEPEALTEIKKKILRDVVGRAANLCSFWAVGALLYGFGSTSLLQTKIPELTTWDNIWPRIIFNSIPALLFGRWYRKSAVHTQLKAYSTAIILPCLLVSAALVHAWPTFWRGEHDLYPLFHASNIVAISTAISITSGPPVLILSQIFGFFVIFFGPLLWLFSTHGQEITLLTIILNDFLFLCSILYMGLSSIYVLRLKLAISEHQTKQMATPFLGQQLTRAIYEHNTELLANYSKTGVVLALDLRGYTLLVQNEEKEGLKSFMAEYHSIVARVVTTHGGFLHKSAGDGHIVSFGLMEREADLSDLPEAQSENASVQTRRKEDYFRYALEAFEEITRLFEAAKFVFLDPQDCKIGAGLAYGTVEVLIRGDPRFRQELDIDGETIVRATRLEAYSKLLGKRVDGDSSFLIIAPEFEDVVQQFEHVKVFNISDPSESVRDYPNIKFIFYRQWNHKRIREIAKAG